jgi:hypothetical protein
MSVAQGVSPEGVNPSGFFRPPLHSAAVGGGMQRACGRLSFSLRADALGYTYSAPLGLTPYPELTLGTGLLCSFSAEYGYPDKTTPKQQHGRRFRRNDPSFNDIIATGLGPVETKVEVQRIEI